MIRILCYGDSNTWGYIPGTDHQRFNENERWTKVLQSKLGSSFEVIEEGMNSRTFFSVETEPGKEGRSGDAFLIPCLKTHDKIDFFILMLGTNELKTIFNNTPEMIVDMLDKFVKKISSYKSQIDGSTPKLIISGIPLVVSNEMNILPEDKYFGAPQKSKKVISLYEEYCNKNGIIFINNIDAEIGSDGIHMTLNGHLKLAEKLYSKIIEECKI